MLGVSAATLRNWSKAGLIALLPGAPAKFLLTEIETLRQSLADGSSGKLGRRANKCCNLSVNRTRGVSGKFMAALAQFPPESVLYAGVVKFLLAAGEITGDDPAHYFSPRKMKFRRPVMQKILGKWRVAPHPELQTLIKLKCTLGPEFLSDLYQALSVTGHKSRRGAFYTPVTVAQTAINTLPNAVGRFLDPCCGTGRYLLAAAKCRRLSMSQIYGIDLDPLAVRIAQINLLMYYQNENTLPNLRTGDFFTARFAKIDSIAGNPPWGVGETPGEESFDRFLRRSLSMLTPGGQLSFLLPESFLKIKKHQELRDMLLKQVSITEIAMLGRQFRQVFTPALRLTVVKHLPLASHQLIVDNGREKSWRPQNSDLFAVHAAAADLALIAKIYQTPHQTLAGNARWALGIVTGDNARFINHEGRGQAVYTGSDVRPWRMKSPTRFIDLTAGEVQQMAPPELYQAPEKLVYRFIGGKLVFACDNTGSLTLNSANVLLPEVPGLSLKAVLALLNSSLFGYLYHHRFGDLKILRGNLEKLPLPLLSADLHAEIVRQTDLLLAGQGDIDVLDELIFSAFSLTPDEKSRIRGKKS